MDNPLFSYIKDFLLVFVWPALIFGFKKHSNENTELKKTQQEHSVRLSVAESKVDGLSEDIKEIKDSIDKLPDRIKSDLKGLIKNGR